LDEDDAGPNDLTGTVSSLLFRALSAKGRHDLENQGYDLTGVGARGCCPLQRRVRPVGRAKQDVQAMRLRSAVEGNAIDLLVYFSRRIMHFEDAEDLLGDTIIAVWRRVADLSTDDARPREWMFGVARRVVANHRRDQANKATL